MNEKVNVYSLNYVGVNIQGFKLRWGMNKRSRKKKSLRSCTILPLEYNKVYTGLM